jgi:TRAP-type transport system periplasmic protein
MLIRSLIFATAAAALLAVPAANPAAAQDKKFVLKVAIFTPEPASSSRWFKIKKDELAKASHGRLDLELFFGASMGPMPRHYDLARTGVADIAWFQEGATPGRFPMTELLQTPFLYPAGAKGAIVGSKVEGDLLPEMQKEHHEVQLLWVVNNRPSGLYDGKKPIRTLGDLKGRRYRTPTQWDVGVLKALGAVPIGIPATEMAESLQKGTIDGVVTDPMGVFTFKLGGLVGYYNDTVRTAITFGLALNKKSRAALPADLGKMVDALGGKAEGVSMATLTWNDFPVFNKYMKDANVETVQLDAAAEKAFRDAAEKVVAEHIAAMEKKGMKAREFYDRAKSLSAKYEKEM